MPVNTSVAAGPEMNSTWFSAASGATWRPTPHGDVSEDDQGDNNNDQGDVTENDQGDDDQGGDVSRDDQGDNNDDQDDGVMGLEAEGQR